MRKLFSLVALACLVLLPLGCKKSAGSMGDSKAFDSATPEIKAAWNKAMTAAKSNDYATAVLTLRELNMVPGLTAAQTKAIEDASKTVNDQMYDAANKGDAAAEKAVQDLRNSLRR